MTVIRPLLLVILLDQLVLFHVRVQCGFPAGVGQVPAGTVRCGLAISSAGFGAGYPHLVRGGCGSTAMAAGRVRVRNFSPCRALKLHSNSILCSVHSYFK